MPVLVASRRGGGCWLKVGSVVLREKGKVHAKVWSEYGETFTRSSLGEYDVQSLDAWPGLWRAGKREANARQVACGSTGLGLS